MRRAKHPLAPALRSIISRGEFYEIKEDEIKYQFKFEELQKLKDYYRKFMPDGRQKFPTLESWYKDLSKEEKMRVIREGDIQTIDSRNFFPDPPGNE